MSNDRKAQAPTETMPELSHEELAAQEAAELPEREEMALVDANIAIPINAAVAANVLSEDSTAIADATQDIDSIQQDA